MKSLSLCVAHTAQQTDNDTMPVSIGLTNIIIFPFFFFSQSDTYKSPETHVGHSPVFGHFIGFCFVFFF